MKPSPFPFKDQFHLLCPKCQTYIPPSQSICPNHDWQRPQDEILPKPGQPTWVGELNGPGVGTPRISGEAVFFTWGGRSSPGGVTALNRFTGEQLWVHEVQQKVVGGVIAINDGLLFGTLGEGKFYCIRQIDHSQIWDYPVQAEIWGKPVIIEEHVYFGDNAGYVHCVNLQSGQGISDKWPVSVSHFPYRIWLTMNKRTIFGASGKGLVFQLNPFSGHVSWQTELGAETRHEPVVFEENLYLGTLSGQIIRLDVRNGHKELFASGLKKVVAAPVISEGLLYVGTHQRSLHAFDLQTREEVWSLTFNHSISSRLVVSAGLLIACVNQDAVYGFDSKTGNQLWKFAIPASANLMTDPLLEDGIVYFGIDSGQVFALPWHLGEYAVIAEWLTTRENYLEAGTFAALAAALTPGTRGHQLQNRAAELWQKGGKPEWVASLLETDLSASPETVAVAYEEAGHYYVRTAPTHAVNFFRKSADWYEIANRADKAQGCVDNATRLIELHHLIEDSLPEKVNTAGDVDIHSNVYMGSVDIPPGLQKALTKNKLILLIGQDLLQRITGVSSRSDLANQLTTQFNLAPSLSFSEAALQISQANNRYNFIEFLHETILQAGLFPQEFHKLLVNFIQSYKIKTIVTMAYDDLLEQAFRERRLPHHTVIQESQLALGRADRPTLFKLFGDLRQPESLIVTAQDQNRLSHEKEWLIKEIIGRFRQNYVLAIGINQVDRIIYELFDHSGNLTPSRFVLHNHPTKELTHTWQNLGFEVIEGDPVQFIRQFIPQPDPTPVVKVSKKSHIAETEEIKQSEIVPGYETSVPNSFVQLDQERLELLSRILDPFIRDLEKELRMNSSYWSNQPIPDPNQSFTATYFTRQAKRVETIRTRLAEFREQINPNRLYHPELLKTVKGLLQELNEQSEQISSLLSYAPDHELGLTIRHITVNIVESARKTQQVLMIARLGEKNANTSLRVQLQTLSIALDQLQGFLEEVSLTARQSSQFLN